MIAKTVARMRATSQHASRIALCLALLPFGCSGEGGSDGSGAQEIGFGFDETFGPGPVALSVRLGSREISLSDRLVCELELVTEAGLIAEFPEYLPEDFEHFSVVKIEYPDGPFPSAVTTKTTTDPDQDAAAEREAASSRRRFRKRLVLEPDRSGELTIAPLAVYYREAAEPREHHFLSDEILVKVEEISDIGSLELAGDPDILDAPPLLIEDRRLIWAGASIGLAALATLIYLVLRYRTRPPPPPPPAHEIAYEALRRLVAHGLVEKGEVELHFVHLSRIVREYIENRFEVRAPERTTEEFLQEASRSPALENHRDRLGEFLGLCDRVKFALLRPDFEAIQQSFDVPKDGTYYCLIVQCPRPASLSSAFVATNGPARAGGAGADKFKTMSYIEFKGARGFLPGPLWAYLPFYGVLFVLYVLVFFWFLCLMGRNKESILGLQWAIAGVMVLGVVETAAWFFTNLARGRVWVGEEGYHWASPGTPPPSLWWRHSVHNS